MKYDNMVEEIKNLPAMKEKYGISSYTGITQEEYLLRKNIFLRNENKKALEQLEKLRNMIFRTSLRMKGTSDEEKNII